VISPHKRRPRCPKRRAGTQPGQGRYWGQLLHRNFPLTAPPEYLLRSLIVRRLLMPELGQSCNCNVVIWVSRCRRAYCQCSTDLLCSVESLVGMYSRVEALLVWPRHLCARACTSFPWPPIAVSDRNKTHTTGLHSTKTKGISNEEDFPSRTFTKRAAALTLGAAERWR
jgi:hypothetical protein